jgi:hypothetical protein
LQVHYEDLKEHPVSTMATVCDFLGLPIKCEHLARCDELVSQTPEKTATTWSTADEDAVEKLCKDYSEFYGRYL